MSRRDKDFVHRTAVFEGGYRAWSYLGSLDASHLDSRSDDLNPIDAGSYRYEPLPRSGLSHPFVKAVLSQWVGGNATQEAVEFGLETLRTWWQHRRSGQSKTAVKKLNNKDNMVLVDQYTRLFFDLAHCLVFSDKEQPPKNLRLTLLQQENANKASPKASGRVSPKAPPKLDIRGKCIPGKLDLPGVVGKVRAAHAAHYGDLSNAKENILGDPTATPIVFISRERDYQIVLEVDGITCAHCVKIVETVLLGCKGTESPIKGLLDAAADRALSKVFIKIASPTDAKRIAFEAARNLSLVGYTAKPKSVPLSSSDEQQRVARSFDRFAKAYPTTFFNWNASCSCPDSGVFRENCPRHAQMNNQLQDTFVGYEQHLRSYTKSQTPANATDVKSEASEVSLEEADLYAPEDEDLDPIPYNVRPQQPRSYMEAYSGAAPTDYSALTIELNSRDTYRRHSRSSIMRTFDDEGILPPDVDAMDTDPQDFYCI